MYHSNLMGNIKCRMSRLFRLVRRMISDASSVAPGVWSWKVSPLFDVGT